MFIVVVCAATAGNYDCTEIYRRSQRGYRCSYDCTDIYRDDEEEDDDEGRKKSFKVA